MVALLLGLTLDRMEFFTRNHFRTFIPNFKITAVKQLSYK